MDIERFEEQDRLLVARKYEKFLNDHFFPFIDALDDLTYPSWQGSDNSFRYSLISLTSKATSISFKELKEQLNKIVYEAYTDGAMQVSGKILFHMGVKASKEHASVTSGVTFNFQNIFYTIGRKEPDYGILIHGNVFEVAIPFTTFTTFFDYVLDDFWYNLLKKLPDSFPFLKIQSKYAPFQSNEGLLTENVALNFIRDLAGRAIENLSEKVVKQLSIPNKQALLSGEDSGLISTWEEICVQVQQSESYFWDVYETTIYENVKMFVKELPEHLSTFLSYEIAEEKDELDQLIIDGKWAFTFDELIISKVSGEVKYQAANYSNERIQRYLYGEDVDEDDEENEDEVDED